MTERDKELIEEAGRTTCDGCLALLEEAETEEARLILEDMARRAYIYEESEYDIQ